MIQICSTLFKRLRRALRVVRPTVLGAIISPFAVGTSMCGETNNCATQCLEFCLPPMHLRDDSRTEVSGLKPTTAGTRISPALLNAVENETVSQGWHFQSSVFRSDRFYLIQSKIKAPPDSALLQFVDIIFTPDVVEVGSVSLSSPILTVAKRKNPLCLLSAFATDKGLLTFNLLELSW